MPNLFVILPPMHHTYVCALSSVALLFADAARRILQVQQNLRVPLQPVWKGIYPVLMFTESISSFSVYPIDHPSPCLQQCQMTMTSVSGHLLELDFSPSFRKW